MKRFRFENCAYFITTCTFNRVKIFSDPEYAQIVVDAIIYGQKQKWYQLLAYVVMPDHIHLIIVPASKDVSAIMKSIKGFSFREINLLNDTKGKLWQEGFHELTLDKIEFVLQKLKYIENNPVRSGLVKNSTDYQFSSAGKYDELDLSSLY
jgi:putative transposase